jgi:hypothetical protein
MARFPIGLATVFVSVFPAVAARVEWGPANNGLRISVSLGETPTSRNILVSFENLGQKDILIPLGMLYGGPHPTFLEVSLKATNGKRPRVIYTRVGAIEGVVEPLTMSLRAGETYTVTLSIDRYYVLDDSEKLATFIKRPCQLWVELEVTDTRCPNPMALDPIRRTLPCWRGKVVSNVLQVPN